MHHFHAPLRLCTALALIIPAAAGATPGALLTVPVTLTPVQSSTDTAYAVAYQQDGTFLVAGTADNGSGKTDFAVARYKADGTLDTSFAPPPPTGEAGPDAGTGITEVGPSSSEVHAVLVQPDGNVLLVGQAVDDVSNHWDFAAARYDADGNLDTNFSAGQPSDLSTGKITTPIGTGDAQANAAALQGNGMLVAAGIAFSGTDQEFALARYDTVGSLDQSFGTGGIVTTNVRSGADDGINAVAVQPDGRIVAAGYVSNGTDLDIAVVRYTGGGKLDTTFNPGGATPGIVTTDFSGANDVAYAMTLQPDGKIVVAGRTGLSFAVVRYNNDGSLDTSFGGGKVTTPVSGGSATAYAVLIQPDGAVLAGGTDGTNFMLTRYTGTGVPDTTFGSGGVVISPAGTGNGTIKALALNPDGTVTAAGYADNTSADRDFAVARYTAVDTPWDLTPDAFSFADAGAVVAGQFATSNTVNITGLSAGVAVPAVVSGGQLLDPGTGQFSTERGWSSNGDGVAVRQLAVAGTNTTTLTVGGIAPPNNNAMVVGSAASASFTSTGISGGGSGAVDPALLLVWAGAGALRRFRRRGGAGDIAGAAS